MRGCKAEVGEEGFFLGGMLVVVEVLGEGWLERVWWCLGWGSRAFGAGEALGSVGGAVIVVDN